MFVPTNEAAMRNAATATIATDSFFKLIKYYFLKIVYLDLDE